MSKPEQELARRTVIKGAGLGLVAGPIAAALPASAMAGDGGEIWSSEYWAKKGDVPLWMYRKRLGAPRAGEAAKNRKIQPRRNTFSYQCAISISANARPENSVVMPRTSSWWA